MKMISKIGIMAGALLCGLSLTAAGQNICPQRPTYGGEVVNPPEVSSQNGKLTVSLAENSSLGPTQMVRYCYVYDKNGQKVESPTLRVNPGDNLVINFTNNISITGGVDGARLLKSRHAPNHPMEMGDAEMAKQTGDYCMGGTVDATTTNIHFHGLNIPPDCHQDEVVNTIIPNGGSQFQYNTTIPANDQFGMYWYHPHPHGFSAPQVFGGAAGAIIINGSNQYTQGLPERIIAIRNNADLRTDDEDGQFSVNFVPTNYPFKPLPIINTIPGQKEFWRVLNASTNGVLNLQVFTDHALPLLVVSIDGIPLDPPQSMTTIEIPPAARAEFITPALQANVTTRLQTAGYDTGAIGDPMQPWVLANIVVSSANASKEPPKMPPAIKQTRVERFSGVASKKPNVQRSLYFSEINVGTNGPAQFFITVKGQIPKVFDAMDPPAIKTKIGNVEDWTIENRAAEVHVFHIHQLHFLVMAIDGVPVPNPYLADTVNVTEWSGSGPYHSITVRMDFSDPQIAGKFVYHCHILDHEDGGMMATIQVDPN
jgi:FtsP/CotA-like multicopper oxidase with cupredoxin domain